MPGLQRGKLFAYLLRNKCYLLADTEEMVRQMAEKLSLDESRFVRSESRSQVIFH